MVEQLTKCSILIKSSKVIGGWSIMDSEDCSALPSSSVKFENSRLNLNDISQGSYKCVLSISKFT